jgi:hypothetical protein
MLMPVRVNWYEHGQIILYTAASPLTREDLEQGAEEVWALAGGVVGLVDMIFDYRTVTHFPNGVQNVVQEGQFALPTLDRIALIGNQPIVEMMMTTLTRATYRPDPTMHPSIEDAASFLKRMAREDQNR